MNSKNVWAKIGHASRIFWFPATLIFVSLLSFPGPALSQQPDGVVTALKGQAQLTRAATQTALAFRDGVILRDIIDTRERSLVRILFGGVSTVTVRELSRLEVREELLPTGARRYVHELTAGAILINVSRKLLSPGDEVVVQTPNAVAGVRGSTMSVETEGDQTIVNCFTADPACFVIPLGSSERSVAPKTSVNILGNPSTGTQATESDLSTKEVNDALDSFEVKGVTNEPEEQQIAQVQTRDATELAEAIVQAITGEAPTTSAATQTAALDTTTSINTSTSAASPGSPGGPPSSPPPPPTLPGGEPDTDPKFNLSGTSTLTKPLLEVTGSLTLGGSLIEVAPAGATIAATPMINSANGTITSGNTINNSALFDSTQGSLTSTTSGILLLEATNSTITNANNGSLFRGSLTGTTADNLINLDASALDSANSILDLQNPNIVLTGSIAKLSNKSTLKNRAGPVIKIVGGSLTADALATTDNSSNTFDFTGTLLDLTDTSVNLRLLGDSDDTAIFNLAANEPWIKSVRSTLTLTDPLEDFVVINPDDFGSIFPGVALVGTDSKFSIAQSMLRFEGTGSASATNPQLQLTGSVAGKSEVTTGSHIVSLSGEGTPTSWTLSGPLFSAAQTNLTVGEGSGADFLEIRDGSSLTGPPKPAATDAAPLITFNQSTLRTDTPVTTTTTRFLDVQLNSELKLGGPILEATGSTFTTNADFARVTQKSVLAGDGKEALFQLSNSTFNIGDDTVQTNGQEPNDNFFRVDDSSGSTVTEPSSVTLKGPLVDDSGSTFTIADNLLRVEDGSTFTSTTADPLITFNGTTYSGGNALTRVGDGSTLNLAGSLLSDSGSNSTFTLTSRFLRVTNDSSLNSTSSDPLVTFSGTVMDTGNDFSRIEDNSKVTLSGSFLSADSSTLDIGTDPVLSGDLVNIRDGGQLIMNTSKPVVELSGGTLTVGTDETDGTSTVNQMFALSGVNTDASGIGTDQPIKGNQPAFTASGETASNPIGTLLKSTEGATIMVKLGPDDAAGGTAVRLDTALLEATLPIIEFMGSSRLTTDRRVVSMTDAKIIANSGFIALRDKSEIFAKMQLLNLDNSLITVKTGALIDLTGGSKMTVGSTADPRDLLRLTNSSKITVVNGPLIRVDGAGTRLDVSRGLASFGSGASQIVVNGLASTRSIVTNDGNIPVRETGGGSVSIGANPIRGTPGGGQFIFTGSIIEASNGGVVDIKAP